MNKYYKRIGKSNFFYNVWYKITKSKYTGKRWGLCGSDHEYESLNIGDYAREEFNSIKLSNDLYYLHSSDRYIFTIGFFSDTRECGIDHLFELILPDKKINKKPIEEYLEKLLINSGAVIDKERNEKDIQRIEEDIKCWQEQLVEIKEIIK